MRFRADTPAVDVTCNAGESICFETELPVCLRESA
jgi:hypothetical protein